MGKKIKVYDKKIWLVCFVYSRVKISQNKD